VRGLIFLIHQQRRVIAVLLGASLNRLDHVLNDLLGIAEHDHGLALASFKLPTFTKSLSGDLRSKNQSSLNPPFPLFFLAWFHPATLHCVLLKRCHF